MTRLKLVGLIKKSRDLNYIIGGKTITLCLKQGEVCCKNGMPLDSYIFKNCKSEIEDYLRNRACPNLNKKYKINSLMNTSRVPGLSTQRIHRY